MYMYLCVYMLLYITDHIILIKVNVLICKLYFKQLHTHICEIIYTYIYVKLDPYLQNTHDYTLEMN